MLAFSAQLENTISSEEFVKLCLDHGVGILRDPNYHPLAGRTENESRDWEFSSCTSCAYPEAAAGHVEWLLQRPFQNVAEWLGAEGDKYRSRPFWPTPEIPVKPRADWFTFAAEHAAKSFDEIVAELKAAVKPSL